MASIKRVVKGQAPSLLDTQKANELIDMINGILSSRAQDPLKLSVDSSGAINLNINLSPLDVVMCANGEPVDRVIYVQTPSPES